LKDRLSTAYSRSYESPDTNVRIYRSRLINEDHCINARQTISMGSNVPSIEIGVTLRGTQKTAGLTAVVDSGATGNVINVTMIQKHRIKRIKIREPLNLINANGTKGLITHKVQLQMTVGTKPHIHKEYVQFYIGDIGNNDVLLGMPWLRKHNPSINWIDGTIKFD
jgi:hypothetical protein